MFERKNGVPYCGPMSGTEQPSDLHQAVRQLSERLTALEERFSPGTGERIQQDNPHSSDAFWALEGLRARLATHPATADGAVMLVGSVALPSGAPVQWQQAAGSAEMFDTDWSDRAASFAALGHPIRLELLRHVLCGTHSTAELAALETLGTTGQLHHHLRQLLSAGWLKQGARGSYEVPAARIVPLLVCLTAVES